MQLSVRAGKVQHDEPLKLYGFAAVDDNGKIWLQKIFTNENKMNTYIAWTENYKRAHENNERYRNGFRGSNKYFAWTKIKRYTLTGKWQPQDAEQMSLELE